MPPQNVPLRHEDYFELKVVKKQQAQRGGLCPRPFFPFIKIVSSRKGVFRSFLGLSLYNRPH